MRNRRKEDWWINTDKSGRSRNVGSFLGTWVFVYFETIQGDGTIFRVGGPIDRFEVYAGNYYQRGDIIAEIDSRDFRIRKERAEAIYNQAKRNLNG